MSARPSDLPELLRAPELRRFARFLLVGVSNTLIAIVLYGLLVSLALDPVLASAAGFLAGALNGYRLNRSWTFRGASGGAETAARYVVVQGIGLALNAAGIWFTVRHAGLPRMAGEAVILPAVTVTTFLLSRRWVFHAPEAI
ncbi:MAG TPA: GtrA family protein [Solirubrobacteraceae bacterium]|nr:GtrA family protein [Solirubrobacteraceae bacterium]